MTWQQWLKWASNKLKNSMHPKLDAEVLLKYVVNKTSAQILAFHDTLINNKQNNQLNKLLTSRITGFPIAYLIKNKEFWSLKINVVHDVFIPRKETEHIVEVILNLSKIPRIAKVLDLGTGTGAISLAISHERPLWEITAVDCQKNALKLAQSNALELNLKNIVFLHSNWFSKLQNKFYNLIISNPPYIDKKDLKLLDKEIHFESKKALISSKNGLKDLEIICKNARLHLSYEGWLVLEHGYQQGNKVRNFFNNSGFTHINTIYDYSGHERVTYGQWLH